MTTIRGYRQGLVLGAMLFVAWAAVGCMNDRSGARTVAEAWEEPARPPGDRTADWGEERTDLSGQVDRGRPLPIATVNGRPISRSKMFGLLVRAHGMAVLGQLIALEVTRQAAETEGISITPADIRAAYDRALDRISSPVPAATQPDLRNEIRETMLAEMLARRGLTREEFNLAMERQAYLRKIAMKYLKIDERALRDQYDMMYDERVQVRHIQLSSWRDVARVKRLLDGGADFADIARTHSQNPRTAPEGGLLPPFSRHQDDVPPLLREAAFKLQPGQVSNPIRIDRDYHLVKPIKRFPKSKVKFEHVKEIVRLRLTERLLPGAMARIERDLIEKARSRIVITDPELSKQFKERYRFRRGGLTRGGT